MTRGCILGDRPHNPVDFSEKRLPYSEGSYCKVCDVWVRKPTYFHIGKGTLIELLPNPWDMLIRYYNKEGKRANVRILEKLEYLVKPVKCPCCGTKCRGKPYGKLKQRTRSKKPVSLQIELAKRKQLDETIARLKTQLEYESDPTLRLDTPEAKKIGTVSSMVRGEIEKTLEEVEKLRKEIGDVT